MQIGRTRLLSISIGLIIVLAFQGRLAAFDTSAPAASNAAVSTKDVPIEFWNWRSSSYVQRSPAPIPRRVLSGLSSISMNFR